MKFASVGFTTAPAWRHGFISRARASADGPFTVKEPQKARTKEVSLRQPLIERLLDLDTLGDIRLQTWEWLDWAFSGLI